MAPDGRSTEGLEPFDTSQVNFSRPLDFGHVDNDMRLIAYRSENRDGMMVQS